MASSSSHTAVCSGGQHAHHTGHIMNREGTPFPLVYNTNGHVVSMMFFFGFRWMTDRASHWGQTPTYLGFPLRIHCDFLSNLSSMYPADTCWVLSQCAQQGAQWILCERTHGFLSKCGSQCAHHFDLNVIGGYIVIAFTMCPARWTLGIFWMFLSQFWAKCAQHVPEPLIEVSFIKYPAMCS